MLRFDEYLKKKFLSASASDALLVTLFFFFVPQFLKLSRIQPKSLLLIEKTCVVNKMSHVGQKKSHVGEKCLMLEKMSHMGKNVSR